MVEKTNEIEITLGRHDDLRPLFPDCRSQLPNHDFLKDDIEHTLGQTLLRDQFYGAWACATKSDDGTYRVKLGSPRATDDLTGYKTIIPAFLKAIKSGFDISRTGNTGKLIAQYPQIRFLPPFGLSMLNNRSIQLLHYPPDETDQFLDYLYSRTNRRWENLLACNDYPGADNGLVETIVDVIPISADGGSTGGDILSNVENEFREYAKQLLQVLLRPGKKGKNTQPMVAYGSSVMPWLMATYGDKIPMKDVQQSYIDLTGDKRGPSTSLAPLYLLSLPISNGLTTPVLCCRHPCLFYRHPTSTYSKAAESGLLYDLVVAGWQKRMSKNWDADPQATLKAVYQEWLGKTDERKVIYENQKQTFVDPADFPKGPAVAKPK